MKTRPIDPSFFLPTALEASRRAAEAILEVYREDFAVEQKEDRSPVTQADRRAHGVIAAALASTGLPVLSEEGKAMPYPEREHWGDFWMVDPLDGTKEFIRKNGEFTVNIALIREGRPILGVVLAPALGRLYFAARGQGAHRVEGPWAPGTDPTAGAQKIRLRPFPAEGGCLRVVASRSHASAETEAYLGELGRKYRVELLSAGSSLKFCLVAEGKADLYPRFAPTMEWDTAAGQAVVEEAGGAVWRRDNGERVGYNKPDLLNPWFLAGFREGGGSI